MRELIKPAFSSCVRGYWLSTNSTWKRSLLLFPCCSPRKRLFSMPYQADIHVTVLWLCVIDRNLSRHSSVPKSLRLLSPLQLLSCVSGGITKHQLKTQNFCVASNMEILQHWGRVSQTWKGHSRKQTYRDTEIRSPPLQRKGTGATLLWLSS